MSEELLQRDLLKNPEKIGKWDFYNIGATTIKALKENRIIRNIDYGKEEKKKVDALIVQKKNVIAVIEYKKPSEFKTAKQKNTAIKQELEVARKLNANIIIATDTKDTIWVNVLTGNRIKDESGKKIQVKFDPKDDKLPELLEKIKFSIHELNDQLKPKELVNPTDLAKQIWQDIWSVSGATPENCLYTFIELFIFKYLSDLGVLQGIHSFNTLIDSFESNTTEEVLENYATTIRPKIKTLFPEGKDNTTIINGTIFVSKDQKAVKGYSTVFKKVLMKFKDYNKLENIDYDFKSQLFESFLKESISKKNWGQFFTPLKVIRAIVKMSKDEIKEGINICDPACGVGKFLLESIVTKLHHFYDVEKKEVKPKVTIHGFDKGFDKDEQKTIILAKANMLIYFSDLIKENIGITKGFSKLFNESFVLKTNSILGTLSEPIEHEYDLILTNPPYVTSGSSNLKEEIRKNGELENYYKINAMGVEGLFMEWIIRALKPNGKAFIVVPDGIFSRQNDKNLRQFILDECYIDGIISLPINTFFTTNKKTYILAVTKKINKEHAQQDPIFTYLVSEIGESRDIYRFDIEQDDLTEAVTLYSFFKGDKQKFANINSDKRCKIQPFNKFKEEITKSWIIDKWWTEEEKVELGIVDKKEKVSLLEFASIIEDVANSIKEFQGEVKELSEKKKPVLKHKTFKVIDLFGIERGRSKYTKKYVDSNKGDYPLYSGNTVGVFAHINTFDYTKGCLSWAIDGLAGYIMIHEEKFSATNHRGVLIPKLKDINLMYVKHILEPIFRKSKKGRIGAKGKNEYTALPPFMIENIEFQMPVNSLGRVDIEAQKYLVAKIEQEQLVKAKVKDYKAQIKDLKVIDLDSFKSRDYLVVDFFDVLKIPKKISKKNLQTAGKYPVYSSQLDKDGLVGYSDLLMFNASHKNPLITFGDHTRVFFVRKTPFSVLDNVKVLKIKPIFKNFIDIDYILYSWQNKIENMGYSRHWKEAKNIKIPIPINSEDKFDLESQKRISNKYKRIEQIKTSITDELNKISSTDIDL